MGSQNTASFPIGQIIAATDGAYAEYQKQLGTEVETTLGKRFRLVQANTADGITGRKKVYTFQDETTYNVDIATAGDPPCGVQLSDQVSLTDECLFWLQIAGLATVVDSGSTMSAQDLCAAAATGDVATQASFDEDTVGRVTAAASANADVVVRLRGGL